MRQKKRTRHHITPLQFLLYTLAVASALFNIRLGKELILETARAVRAEKAVAAYRDHVEAMDVTLHGRVTKAFRCVLRPEFQNSFDKLLAEGSITTTSLSKHIRLSKNRPFR